LTDNPQSTVDQGGADFIKKHSFDLAQTADRSGLERTGFLVRLVEANGMPTPQAAKLEEG
jgi:hypothetical protein